VGLAPFLLDRLPGGCGFLQQQVLLFQRSCFSSSCMRRLSRWPASGRFRPALLLQALAPRGQAVEDVRGVALVRRRQFDALLHLHDAGARFGRLFLGRAPGGVQFRQALVLRSTAICAPSTRAASSSRRNSASSICSWVSLAWFSHCSRWAVSVPIWFCRRVRDSTTNLICASRLPISELVWYSSPWAACRRSPVA
jgi:hypothetical protein